MPDNFIALAASKKQIAETQAKRDGKRIHNLSKKHGSAVAQVWDDELLEAIDHILVVLRNNRGREESVLNRLDVQSGIFNAAELAAAMGKAKVDSAWNTGSLLGNAMARRQAKILGLPKPSAVMPDDALRLLLRADMDNLATDVRKGLEEAILAQDDELFEKARRKAVLRARMTGEAAVKMSSQAALQESLGGAGGLFKRWVTTSVVPCSNCVALSKGAPILVHEAFPSSSLTVYGGGVLMGPPLHPNCACILVIEKE